MKKDKNTEQICPKCGQYYIAPPALSRTDNKTLICSDCGIREAYESIGFTNEEQDMILATIRTKQNSYSRHQITKYFNAPV